MKGNWKIRKYMEIKQRILKYREGNGTPLQYSCLEDPMDWGVWKAAAHGVVKSRAQLSDFAFTFHFHALEKAMTTHSSILACRIPGMGEPSGLPSMVSHRVRHNWSDLAAAAASQCLHSPLSLSSRGFLVPLLLCSSKKISQGQCFQAKDARNRSLTSLSDCCISSHAMLSHLLGLS